MDTLNKIPKSGLKSWPWSFCILLFALGIFSLRPVFAQDFTLNGFLETNYSFRLSNDKPAGAEYQNLILAEQRLQLKASYYPSRGNIGFFIKSDFYLDGVNGDSGVELREGYLDFSDDRFALRLGRQIITWGVGDLLFVNDVFPKDWQAFYSGRALEYLKKGVDSIKLDLYSDSVSLEAVAIPYFEADTLPSPDRFHLLFPYPNITNRKVLKPETAFKNTEYAFRLYSRFAGSDVSVYLYKGFFRTPGIGADNFITPSTVSSIYPRLAISGFSLQRSALGGVVSAEAGYYDSLDDRAGNNPGIENSQTRFLLGFQKAFPEDFTVGLQYYGELRHKYHQYQENLPPGWTRKDKFHQYLTLRLTRLLEYQTLMLSLFTFYSPDEKDFLIIPEVGYNFTDNLKGVLGANIFGGNKPDTTFGQLNKDDNLYLRLRSSF